MIRALLHNPDTGGVVRGGQELIESWQASDNGMLWLDIGSEEPGVETHLLRQFDIHELTIQDALRQRHPPKVESFQNYLFILLRGLDADSKTLDFGVIQLSLFVGDRFLVTRHNKPSVSANRLWEMILETPEIVAEGSGALALRLANRMADRYIEILLDLEPKLDAVEQEVFKRPNDTQLEELAGYKSNLRHLSRIARYHEHVVRQLRNFESPYIPDSLSHELTDLYEQIERTQSLSDLYFNVASDLTDGYLALSSHRLNNVMQVLTIITVLFVPLTFIAGIYGMNFSNMPELATDNGYFVVIGAMVVTVICQLVYFRRKGWL